MTYSVIPAREFHSRVIDVATRGTTSIPLSDLSHGGKLVLYPQVEERGYFSFHFKGTELRLTAGPFIGLIPICPGITINVQPRLPVANLTRVIDLAQRSLGFIDGVDRGYAWASEGANGVLELLLRGLVTALEPVDLFGMDRRYVRRQAVSSSPRGRIDVHATYSRLFARGIRHRVVHSRFEQTVDTPANRLIKTALVDGARRLSRTASPPAQLLRDVNRTIRRFDAVQSEVSPIAAAAALEASSRVHSSSREYYRRPIRIAAVILAGKSLSLDGRHGDFDAASFVLNFEDLFEEYIREVVSAGFRGIPTSDCTALSGKVPPGRKSFFDDPELPTAPTAQPDLVIQRKDAWPVVADVKYRAATKREDWNQLIPYAVRYRASTAAIIHLSDGERSLAVRHGKLQDTTYYSLAFDLAAASLESEESALVTALHGFATESHPSAPV
ncbi:MAG: hypothetical protein NTU67_08870 [Gemmatimonadetes bacterium]|nr:hypothetical protein [Gemmatimonadota bacterium]